MTRTARALSSAGVALALAGFPSAPLAALPHPSEAIARCQAAVRDHPSDLEAYRCFWSAARNLQSWDDATRALEAMLTIDPANHRARLYLAAIEADQGRDRAESLYVQAADGFAATNDATGEAYARLALAYFLRARSRLDAAGPQLERAHRAASSSGDRVLLGRVLAARAMLCADREDYGCALRLEREAETAVFPDGPSDIRSAVLSGLGRVHWALGLYRKATEFYAREVDVLSAAGDQFAVVGPRYNIALLAGEMLESGQIELGEYLARVREVLDAALRVHHPAIEIRARLLLGETLEGAAAIDQATRALDRARQVGDRRSARAALNLLALRTWDAAPDGRDEALSFVDRSLADARATGETEDVARGLIVRAELQWKAGDHDGWTSTAQEAMAAIEKVRDLQPEGTVRARVFSRWAEVYHRFSGWLLGDLAGSPSPASDLDLAIRIAERMRARTLLDELDAAHVPPSAGRDDPLGEQRAAVLSRIGEVQKRLLAPSLATGDRQSALGELERLEAEEEDLRDALARQDPTFARRRAPSIPSLAELQARLAGDQALLLYQLSTHEHTAWRRLDAGGSWVVVMTRDEARAIPLPDEDVLEAQVAVFVGLFLRRDGSERAAAGELGHALLAAALNEAPPRVRRLVIVPDGVLHQLPFEALAVDGSGAPVIARYEVAYAPSAALWLRWKDDGRPIATGGVLSLADPLLPAAPATAIQRTADGWLEGLRLGPLPFARREANALTSAAGGDSRLFSGGEATEKRLKTTSLGDFSVIHLAAHAVVDDDHPERSAVVLAPGDGEEDGLLQASEIAGLDLRGKVVILSACRTASGAVLEGEGVLGLARAFFEAGARAVIGSLWPLRDDDAAALMEQLSRELARGQPVAAALADARRERLAAGAPTAAWAGLVVLGDGDAAPLAVRRGEAGAARHWLWWLVPTAVLAGAGFLAYRVVRRIRNPQGCSATR